MKRPEMNRRDFNRLTFAAFGGMVAGSTMSGCQSKTPPAPATPPAGESEAGSTTKDDHDHVEGDKDVSLLMSEPHVCRGLNTCKGKHGGVENDCAGLGACASVAAHTCSGANECKGQGGCGTNPGMNSCKGKGGCSVPLMEDAWKLARVEFEKSMEKAGKKVGPAPAAKK
ncbi:MAG: hypothetical protein K0U86_22525 [Planctomycetes bacterium]|nr:hypothetical protein [Planctomycetota bacterium]MCH9727685.1 hypothetical protein [Planctomycetota bacterium]MCH9775110.1 hypothetical protein [Planctomycetota bacterium]MCH9790340.1 hypothetical protein [Planctomycetota bacterium]MDF1745360.1 hypothetical protein [Gimesia sp.]